MLEATKQANWLCSYYMTDNICGHQASYLRRTACLCVKMGQEQFWILKSSDFAIVLTNV